MGGPREGDGRCPGGALLFGRRGGRRVLRGEDVGLPQVPGGAHIPCMKLGKHWHARRARRGDLEDFPKEVEESGGARCPDR
jgi:hypothetical protein